jgi:hypothetical protein
MNPNFDTQIKCHHCGMWHGGQCPRVKRIEYYSDGTTKSVEYHDPNDRKHPFVPPHFEYPGRDVPPTVPPIGDED